VSNNDERSSRKGAKTQRKAFKINNLSTPLRAFFASLRLCAKLPFFLFQTVPLPLLQPRLTLPSVAHESQSSLWKKPESFGLRLSQSGFTGKSAKS
jgi:hypothetical protein